MTNPIARSLALVVALAPAVAQDDTTPPPAPLRVKCVDARGEPVANAAVEVFAPRLRDGVVRYEHRGARRSDAHGDCEPVPDATRLYWLGPFVHARVPGQLVGMRSTELLGKSDEITVVLTPPCALQGSVRVPEGARAESVRVQLVDVRNPKSSSRDELMLPRIVLDTTASLYAEVEKVLPGQLETSVAADGSFQIAELPAGTDADLAAAGPGLAMTRQTASMTAAGTARVEITLPREAVFAGRIFGPDGKPAAGAAITLELDPTWAIRNRRAASRFSALADAEGQFRVHGLPDGQYVLTLRSDVGCLRPAPIVLATAEQRTNEVLQLEAGLEVSGIVLAADDRSPVVDAAVSAGTDAKMFASQTIARTRTDPTGRFTLRVPSGAAWLHVHATKFTTPNPRELQLGGTAAAPAPLEVILQRR